jgi:hypothetical protein
MAFKTALVLILRAGAAAVTYRGHVTAWPLAIKIFVWLIVLTFFTYRFATKEPRLRLDVFSLLAVVLAGAYEMQPNSDTLPMTGATILLAICGSQTGSRGGRHHIAATIQYMNAANPTPGRNVTARGGLW